MHLKGYCLKPSSDFVPAHSSETLPTGWYPTSPCFPLSSEYTYTYTRDLKKAAAGCLVCISCSFLAVKSTPASTHYTTTAPYLLQCWGNHSRNYNTPGEDVTVSDQGCQKIPSIPVALPEADTANA